MPELPPPLPSRHKQHIGQGIAFAISAAICFTLMSLISKFINHKVSTFTILFARFGISLVLLTPWIIKNPKKLIQDIQPSKVLLRSIFTFIAFGCFFYSLKYISLANGLLLNNTFPLFIPLSAWVLLGVKTRYKVWGGIILGFIGIILILHPDTNLFSRASLIGLASGISASIAIVMTRTLTKTLTIVQILFYNWVFCSIFSAILMLFEYKPLDSSVLIHLFLIGILGGIYQLCSTFAIAKASVRLTSPLMFLCIVFGAFADYFIWNHIPDAFTLVGMLLVILGGMLTIYFGHKSINH